MERVSVGEKGVESGGGSLPHGQFKYKYFADRQDLSSSLITYVHVWVYVYVICNVVCEAYKLYSVYTWCILYM